MTKIFMKNMPTLQFVNLVKLHFVKSNSTNFLIKLLNSFFIVTIGTVFTWNNSILVSVCM